MCLAFGLGVLITLQIPLKLYVGVRLKKMDQEGILQIEMLLLEY